MNAPGISRRQAWMKLAVLIADGMPDPLQIDFFSGDAINVKLDDADSFRAWAEHLGAHQSPPQPNSNGARWIYTTAAHWFGWYVSLTAYPPRIPDVETATEDLAAVRTLADAIPDVAPPGNAVAGVAASATAPEFDLGPVVDEPDPCPKGDPDCETGDDGSCHDGCEPATDPAALDDLGVAFTGVAAVTP